MADVRVKICGLTRVEDADAALELGAWALGVIFFQASPRYCELERARQIVRRGRRRAELCGVFVNAHLDEVVATADGLGLTMLQLQGDEGPAYCAEAGRRTGCRVTKAASMRSRADLQAIKAFATDFHLLDGALEGLRGGTGQTFDWSLVAEHGHKTPLIVSGGLHAGNVGDAIAATKPFAVDTASGTERAPGVKDHDRLERFFAAVAAGDPTPANAAADSGLLPAAANTDADTGPRPAAAHPA